MSTAAQAMANTANSLLSTGPRTEEGKRASSANSFKHGLTSKQIVLPGEDPAAYNDLRTSLESEWRPGTTQESVLVDQIAQHAWRLQRARRVETASFNRFMPPLEGSPRYVRGKLQVVPVDPDEALAGAFHNNHKDFDNLRRYEAAIERSYYKAITELRKHQASRRDVEKENGFVSQSPKQPAAAAPEIGFVSHNPANSRSKPSQALGLDFKSASICANPRPAILSAPTF
jgi:hypothetical protein